MKLKGESRAGKSNAALSHPYNKKIVLGFDKVEKRHYNFELVAHTMKKEATNVKRTSSMGQSKTAERANLDKVRSAPTEMKSTVANMSRRPNMAGRLIRLFIGCMV